MATRWKIITSPSLSLLLAFTRISISSISSWKAGFVAEDADSNTLSSIEASNCCVDWDIASCTCLACNKSGRVDVWRDDDGRGDEVDEGLKGGPKVESVVLLNCPNICPWRLTESGSVTWDRSLSWYDHWLTMKLVLGRRSVIQTGSRATADDGRRAHAGTYAVWIKRGNEGFTEIEKNRIDRTWQKDVNCM